MDCKHFHSSTSLTEATMPDTVPKPEHEFLNALRKEHKRVSVFLVNGIKLTGRIES